MILWGTGSAKREFLHVDDLADAAVFLMNHFEGSDIVNVGTGADLSIKELAEMIKSIMGYDGALIWDTSKPDGTPRKLLDVNRLRSLGWKHKHTLPDGIKKTIDWFILNRKEIARM